MSFFGPLYQLEQYIRDRLGHSREASGQRLSRQQSSDGDTDSASIQSLLPPEILLNIFAYLEPRDLSACACVSRHFNQISSDELLWQFLLDRDMPTWPRLTHDRNPEAIIGRVSSQEVYISCCPLVRPSTQPAWYLPGGLGYERVRQYLSKRLKRNPRFALLGSGIESKRTSKLVYSLVHNKLGKQFEPISMINGVDGIGSGITYRMTTDDGSSSHVFDLLTLYSSRREDRDRQLSEAQRVRSSILLQPAAAASPTPEQDSVPSSDQRRYQVIPTVTRLELDGIIYTVDAESSIQEVSDSRPELEAFAASLQPSRPVLVLPLIGRSDRRRVVSCHQVVRALGLTHLPNPWCVQESESKSLGALAQSLVWMMEHA